MRSFELRVGVSGEIKLADSLKLAVTVFVPDQVGTETPVIFGYPGGGFNRKYYDIQMLPGYSQAEYHTNTGCIFVACDHIGVGDSTPCDPLELTFEVVAQANHLVALEVLERLKNGRVDHSLPAITPTRVVGIGQSFGGAAIIVQQGVHRTFDAIATLGNGVVQNSLPLEDGSRLYTSVTPRDSKQMRAAASLKVSEPLRNRDVPAIVRYIFHWEEDELALVEEDSISVSDGAPPAPWKASVIPGARVHIHVPNYLVPEASQIDVPVLIACGEVDILDDPWQEPAAFRNSSDVSLLVIERMAHMHNFAQTRHVLWHRIASMAEPNSRS